MDRSTGGRQNEFRQLNSIAFTARFLGFVLKYNLLVIGAWIASAFGTLAGDAHARETVSIAFERMVADEHRSFAIELDRRGW